MLGNEKKCFLCPRECGADRTKKSGFCGIKSDIVVAKVMLHMFEEPPISGTKGSGTIFFAGCNLRCGFCQNRKISFYNENSYENSIDLAVENNTFVNKNSKKTTPYSDNAFQKSEDISLKTYQKSGKLIKVNPQELSKIMLNLQDEGAHNINLVTAGHMLFGVVEALKLCKTYLKIPVIYNSSGYEKAEAIALLSGLVDVYLPDFKYADSELSEKLSGAANYPSVAKAAITEMVRQTGAVTVCDGLIKRGTIIRHLVLPGFRENSIKVAEAIAENFSLAQISLMSQYTPEFNCLDIKSLSRRLTTFEYKSVLERVIELNLVGFMQEKSSATKIYTPNF